MQVEPVQIQQWLGFLAELRQWNRSYNLVAPGAVNALVPRHLLDSLSVCDHLASGSVLDVGTGAGFPGLALAIARPEQPFCLLDACEIRKKREIKIISF